MLQELKAKAFDAHIEVLKLQDSLKKAEQYYVECVNKALDAEKDSLPSNDK